MPTVVPNTALIAGSLSRRWVEDEAASYIRVMQNLPKWREKGIDLVSIIIHTDVSGFPDNKNGLLSRMFGIGRYYQGWRETEEHYLKRVFGGLEGFVYYKGKGCIVARRTVGQDKLDLVFDLETRLNEEVKEVNLIIPRYLRLPKIAETLTVRTHEYHLRFNPTKMAPEPLEKVKLLYQLMEFEA